MPVGELRQRMSNDERHEWLAYFTWRNAITNMKEVT